MSPELLYLCKPAAPAQSGSMFNGTRTVRQYNVSQSGCDASGSQAVKNTFDDGSLQHQRLAMFESRHRLDDGALYVRFQDSTLPTTANSDEVARIAFHQNRAAEAIHQFDNTFDSNK
ncbi:hypothetical protein NEUTE1DRAFT_138240 [Neurospora tetrasperma FGSC 2508]|uniref:Uncharacterized protein n=1 Tax=Neurospora tetrasperma (strain FGSC 2508 / ATCC MYA-4615 / P0657) TaxID=510951 RepID=F8MR73_NEUT8|nr:uncharacterized protein NEUTE1DRAFT_138240 [Neurospora tetrasperma FGSC 2508]EGO56032.1 hypothetical protein NEUTE1DRAFT_138240 [Neurospora tetrasperma FGSC 2508]EGZ71120.1 hypothetical protein NEUTE2DRAFT_168400 [Neurospora tetrasperma FGSC 2509]